MLNREKGLRVRDYEYLLNLNPYPIILDPKIAFTSITYRPGPDHIRVCLNLRYQFIGNRCFEINYIISYISITLV